MKATDSAKLGLRERKKLKTRAAIQHNAIRLFLEQGYHETTVEQIAEAAEVSPSTFFRYFQTKEALVLEDDFDPMLVELYKSQPRDVHPIQAYLNVIKESKARISAEARQEIRTRMEIVAKVPELQAALMGQMNNTLDLFAELVAERLEKGKDDLAALAIAGAMVGIVMGANAYFLRQPGVDFIDAIESAVEQYCRETLGIKQG